MNAYLESIKREIKDCEDVEVLRYLANDLADEQFELRKRIEQLLNDCGVILAAASIVYEEHKESFKELATK